MFRNIFIISVLLLSLFAPAGDGVSSSTRIDSSILDRSSMVRISTFDIDATPPVGSHLTYQIMQNLWDLGLRARGIVILGAGKPIVLLAVDWIGISNDSQDAFKKALAEAAGTIPERVAVHTLHQHDAPICDFTSEKLLKEAGIDPGCFEGSYTRKLIDNLQDAVENSLNNTRPVTHISFGEAPVYRVASNRRVIKEDGRVDKLRGSTCKDSSLRAKPEGVIDPMVSVISFWNEENPLAILSFYATHPQSYYLTGIANPDFPGIARFYRQLEVPDALHVHFNGAGGNIAAGKYNDGSHEMRGILAGRLADGMKRAWKNSRKSEITPEQVDWEIRDINLPPAGNIEEIEKKMKDKKNPFNYLPNNMGKLAWLKRCQSGKMNNISCLSLGDVRILFMPGELFVEYQLAAKAMRPDLSVVMAAYGDYGPFYIGTKEAYSQGGYEINASPVTEEAESIIMMAMKELLYVSDEVSFFSSQNRKKILIKDKADWEQQRGEILKGIEAVMGPLPCREGLPPLDVRVTEELINETYTRQTIIFKAYRDERVPVYLYIPHRKGTNGKLPAMVALHPTGSDGKKIVDGEGKANRGYAKELAERGYIVIAPDYPSFGELTNFDFEKDRYQSGTMAGIFYHMRCVDLLVMREDVDPDRIGVIGHSLGGHNAMFLAAFDERIKVIVSSCGWTQFEYYDIGERAIEKYGGRLGPWSQDRYMPLIKEKYDLDGDKIPFNFHEIIALFAPRAFFSNSPLNDSNFDVTGVIKGVEEARKIYRFLGAGDNLQVRYPEAEHDFPEEIRLEAYSFIDQILQHTPNKHDISKY